MAEDHRHLPGGVGGYGSASRPSRAVLEYTPTRSTEAPGAGGRATVDFDPVSRVAGPLAFHTVLDLDSREVVETAAMPNLFRGYEIILEGRDPRDALFVSSRACGVCGSAHAPTAALAVEMAFGIQPPPMSVAMRNLLLACDALADYCLQL